MAPLPWVNLGLSVVLFVAWAMLYLDGRGQRAALAALRRQATADHEHLAALTRALAQLAPAPVLAGSAVQPSADTAPTSGASTGRRRITSHPAAAADADAAPLTPPSTHRGDDGRRTSSKPPPPVLLLTPPPRAPNPDTRIRLRWAELIAAAHDAGKDARHCQRGRCFRKDEAISDCACACAGCVLAAELFIAAHRELMGRE